FDDMRLFTYCLRNDCGASPNPYGGYCTLALTKPVIRRTAEVGDWVVGLASHETGFKNANRHIVFAMKVTEIMTLQEYDLFSQRQCPDKLPQRPAKTYEQFVGDSIYEFIEGVDDPILRDSVHDDSNFATDMQAEKVLLSTEFVYWGSEAPELPENLWKIIKKGKGQQVDKNKNYIKDFLNFMQDFELHTIVAPPCNKIENWYGAESRGQCAEKDLEDNAIDEKIGS
ncbi:MAG: hypothetical protein KDD40_09935, partial [Bdellovibrionales bacterium]|nr:hypothetical protein [Bdellovibrionales bacterium]